MLIKIGNIPTKVNEKDYIYEKLEGRMTSYSHCLWVFVDIDMMKDKGQTRKGKFEG